MSNRRDFLKLLGLGAIAPVIPKIPIEPAKAVTTNVLVGKIKTGGLIANIENNSSTLRFGVDGPERFRIYANQSMSKMYEEALWFGNPITNKNK
jgi:hypothetical protein